MAEGGLSVLRSCRIFIPLDPDVLDDVRHEFEAIVIRDGQWGYVTMIVADLDGNELYFPYPGSRPA